MRRLSCALQDLQKVTLRAIRQLNPCATVLFSFRLHILTVSLKHTNCDRGLTHTMAVLTLISSSKWPQSRTGSVVRTLS